MQRSRRRALQRLGSGLLATGVLGVAGCLDDGPGTTSKPTESPTEPPDSGRLDTDPGGGFRWAFDLGGSAHPPLVHDGVVLAATEAGVVRAIDSEGSVQWRAETVNAINSGATGEAVSFHHGHLLVVSGENRGTGGEDYVLHALDPESGDERWRYSLGRDWLGVLGAAAGGIAVGEGDDAIGPDGDRTALVEPDGSTRWTAETGDPTAVADGGGRVYVGAYSAVRGFDADTGERKWRIDAEPGYLGLLADETRLYTVEDAEQGQRLVGRDGETGEERWHADWQATSLHPTGSDGVVAGGERLAAYAPDGTERWRYEPGGSAYGPATAETLFTGSGRSVAAVGLADGAERWRTAVTGTESVFPRAYGDGVLVSEILGSGEYVAHDTETGEQRWTVELEADRNPGVAVAPGTVYVMAADGTLYARNP